MLLFLAATLMQASANPLVADAKQRPVRMLAEDVTISVGPEVSLVKGTYRFEQRPDDWPSEKDTHVLIYVPVYLHQNAEPGISDPVVKVGGRSIKSREWDDLGLADDPSSGFPDAPKGFYLKAYQYAVPLDLVKGTFTISVEYLQPSFRGHVAGYLPIKPPTRAGAGRITFTAQPGYVLKPFTARNFWNPLFPSLAFTPKDHELLRVKCVKAR